MIGCCGSRFWGETTTRLVESFEKVSEMTGHADDHPPSGAFWLLISVVCEYGPTSSSSSVNEICSGYTLRRVVFAAGILVGIAAFKDDWSTQACKADNFLGGTWARRRCHPLYSTDLPPGSP
jgi:hypothetical protein